MNNNSLDQITGKGMVFPILVDGGTIKPISGWELIRSCIINILAFELGQRYFQRDFGVGLQGMLEEPNDIVTQTILEHRLDIQLPQWDKRITIEDIHFDRSNPSNLIIVINVILTGTAQRESIIYPINSAI